MLGATTAGTAEVTKNEKGLRHDAADVARPALELPPHYARTLWFGDAHDPPCRTAPLAPFRFRQTQKGRRHSSYSQACLTHTTIVAIVSCWHACYPAMRRRWQTSTTGTGRRCFDTPWH
jgi:hypothetical protein